MPDTNPNVLQNAKTVHFIGIGGISMSALAKILNVHGYAVSGSDIRATNITEDLQRHNISVCIGHRAENIPKNCDLVVYTAAIASDNPERVAAQERNIPAIERSVLLGLIMKRYQNAICISGTHGKTTTTSMLSVILLECGLDPTITVGGELAQIGGNLHLGGREYFVTEACEYVDSFLQFYPTIAIFTNIEEDHLDYFKDIHQIIRSFSTFAKKLPHEGLLAANCDDENVMEAAKGAACQIATYSVKDKAADYFAGSIRFDDGGYPTFSLWVRGEKRMEVSLSVPGIHNVYNALSVFAVCDFLGLDLERCAQALYHFTGTKRRFERKGTFQGALVLDDYAHHPTEISATLAAASKLKHREIWCVFQPHTYTRTRLLFDDFLRALSGCDHVIFTDIYAAREKDTGLVHAHDLADKLENATYLSSFEEIERYLKEHAKPNDIIITMGAGDVYKIGEALLHE